MVFVLFCFKEYFFKYNASKIVAICYGKSGETQTIFTPWRIVHKLGNIWEICGEHLKFFYDQLWQYQKQTVDIFIYIYIYI